MIPIPFKPWLRRVPGYRILGDTLKAILDPRFRSEWRLRRKRPAGMFQYSVVTADNRYPRVFAFLRAQLAGQERPRLLSFGCSTGEEVFTLRRYFPTAEILGLDINPWAIAQCRKRLAAMGGDPRIHFEQAANLDGQADASFDAILCMAVLRHGDLSAEGIRRCDPILYFTDFVRVVGEMERCLVPGGLLSIMHSHFRFKDTASAARFETVLAVSLPTAKPLPPLFGPDNLRLGDEPYLEAVFRKYTESTACRT